MKIIEKLLEGTTYYNAATREAIYFVTISGFNQLHGTVRLVAEIAEYKNTGTTAETITNNLTQLFIEEIIVDKTKTNRYQLASIKLIKQRLKTRKVKQKWGGLQKRLKIMPGEIQSIQKYYTTLRYLSDYSEIIEWYAGCSIFDIQFPLQKRIRTNTDNLTEDDGKIQKRKEEMHTFKTVIRKYLGSMVLRNLNAGHNQIVKRLNKRYAKLQTKE